jgi:hypothetical protein
MIVLGTEWTIADYRRPSAGILAAAITGQFILLPGHIGWVPVRSLEIQPAVAQ